MQRVTIFQVGDVHFPEHNAVDADVKDQAFPASLVNVTTSSQLQGATKALITQLATAPDAAIVFSGDLTSRGDLDSYRECVDYLVQAFLLTDAAKWNPDRIHVVPGNHDVNRQLAAVQSADDLHTKFHPLRDAWQRHGLDVLPAAAPRHTTHGNASARVDLFGLNTCLGCGEQRTLPTGIQDSVRNALQATTLTPDEIDDLMRDLVASTTETIDAPALAQDDIGEVCEFVLTRDDVGLPVLIGHHNVLQQALPRFDLYTDLVNAGMFRSRLSSLDRPVLYLHGHIHSDAIEIVEQATPDHGQLVSISCPEFKDGFNRIDVCFNDDGVALGCIITKFRVRLHSGIAQDGEPIRIPLLQQEPALSSVARDAAAHVLADPEIGLISELHKRLGGTISMEEVGEAVQELEWLGILQVLAAGKAIRSWRLRVVTINEQ